MCRYESVAWSFGRLVAWSSVIGANLRFMPRLRDSMTKRLHDHVPHVYPFNPVVAMPSIKVFWVKK